MAWYYVMDGERVGPVEEEQLRGLVASGTVTPETLVWADGMSDWVPYGEVGAASAEAEGVDENRANSVPCAECGRHFPASDLVEIEGASVCANCKPLALQKMREGVSVSTGMNYAGFWIRAGAKILDHIILSAANYGIGLAIGFAMVSGGEPGQAAAAVADAVAGLIGFVVGIAYTTYFLGAHGATPGKMAGGLKVVSPDGGKIGYGRAFGRSFAEMLSGLILGIGYLMAAFDEEKRTLHDRICGTRVIRK